MLKQLERKDADIERIASAVIRRPETLPEVFDGLSAEKAAVRFGSVKVLRAVAQRDPGLLYGEIDRVLALVAHENQILRWNGILLLGDLAAVDSRGRITRILDRYLEPIPGPDLITATNVIRGATRIALAKPRQTDRIVEAILKVERARYRTAECRHIACGHAIDALDQLYDETKRKAQIATFVGKQRKSRRNATKKRAERFTKKWLHAGAGS